MGRLRYYGEASERVDPPEEDTYECPICGSEISPGTDLYINENGDVIGCEECVHTKQAEDYFTED